MVDTSKLELNKITILNDYFVEFKRVKVEFYSQLEELNEREVVELFGYKYTEAFKLIDLIDEVYKHIIKDTIANIYNGDLEYVAGAPKSFYEIHVIDLPLSVRSYNCLVRANIKTLGAIIDNKHRLHCVRNLGRQSIKEINKIISDYLDNPKRKINKDTNTYNNESISIPLDELNLSVRAYNCLKRANYKTLSEIIDLTLDDLLMIRNMGRKTAKEIVEKIDYYKNDYNNYTVSSMITLLLSLNKRLSSFAYKNLHISKFPNINLDILVNYDIPTSISFIDLYNKVLSLADNDKITPKDAHHFYTFFYSYLKNDIEDYEIQLDDRSIYILTRRLLNESFRDIGKSMNISGQRVQQIYKRTIKIIKEYFEEKQLSLYFLDDKYTKENKTILNDELYSICFYVLDELLPVYKSRVDDEIGYITERYSRELGIGIEFILF